MTDTLYPNDRLKCDVIDVWPPLVKYRCPPFFLCVLRVSAVNQSCFRYFVPSPKFGTGSLASGGG